MERKRSPFIPSLAPDAADLSLDRLLHPARFYDHPRDVLADPSLDIRARRAILSSWASDACAVESMPALRQPPGVPGPIAFDEIMDALRALDAGSERWPLDASPRAAHGRQHLDA